MRRPLARVLRLVIDIVVRDRRAAAVRRLPDHRNAGSGEIGGGLLHLVRHAPGPPTARFRPLARIGDPGHPVHAANLNLVPGAGSKARQRTRHCRGFRR